MWKSRLISPYAQWISSQVVAQSSNAMADQDKIFQELIAKAKDTVWGKDHGYAYIRNFESFRQQVPIRDYEAAKDYFDRTAQGQVNILWPGRPKYLAKTSGTTSGTKYIPITRQSIPHHIHSARKALLHYVSIAKRYDIFDGKVLFLSGSPEMDKLNGIYLGRLSGIVNHEIPFWLKSNQIPSYKTNCIEDWEAKVDKIVAETSKADLRLVSGIPPWVQMYFERLLDYTGKSTIQQVFPNLKLFVYGGVNYEPYRNALQELIGGELDSLETFPASEGFFAFQDQIGSSELLLNTNAGIFYEFVPLQEHHKEHPTRLGLREVEIGVDYAMIISSDAGLWAYDLGDTIQFTSIQPYRLIVTGRVKHFLSAFGEHVISKEVEQALVTAMKVHGGQVREFTVAPVVMPNVGLKPHHEWWIEFDSFPDDLEQFARTLDQVMCTQNSYYKDLIEGQIISSLKIQSVRQDGFREYMKTQGKLGGQNKLPRLSNDRKLVDQLAIFLGY